MQRKKSPSSGSDIEDVRSAIMSSRGESIKGKRETALQTQLRALQKNPQLVFIVPFVIIIVLLLRPSPTPGNVRPAQLQIQWGKETKTLTKDGTLGLGPDGTPRQNFRYYDSVYYTAKQYGVLAQSAIEVGCAADPFLKYLDWIDRKVCVAPYFVEYGKTGDANTIQGGNNIEGVTADFMEYKPRNNEKFDLLLCNQVLELVLDPAAFMKKLISTARTSIISVPYNWSPCSNPKGGCGHMTDHIKYKTLLKWSEPHVPVFSSIVTENFGDNSKDKHFAKRIILVYENN